jgi:hypothetical protein
MGPRSDRERLPGLSFHLKSTRAGADDASPASPATCNPVPIESMIGPLPARSGLLKGGARSLLARRASHQ